MAVYERSRSTRDRRDHLYDDEDHPMASVSQDDYYRSRAPREVIQPPTSLSHHHERLSPRLDYQYIEDDRPRHARPQSPHASDARWQQREKVAHSTHATYTATPYDRPHDRPHDDGYGRRPIEDHYRTAAYPEEAWPPPQHPVKDDYNPGPSANYSSWDRPSTYTHPLDHEERARHAHTHPQRHSAAQVPSHSRSTYDWTEDDRSDVVKHPTDRRGDERDWTRRRDDREWTRDDGRAVREDSSTRTAGRGNWEGRASYARDSSPKAPQPKFAPGPGWKGDDTPSQSRSTNGASWKAKGQYNGRKKDKDGGRHSKTNDYDNRYRDNGHSGKRSGNRGQGSSKSERKARKRRRSASRSPSHSRSRSRSTSPQSYSYATQSATSSPKRRRKASASPERSGGRVGHKSKAAFKERSISPQSARGDDARGRSQYRASSRTHSTSRDRRHTSTSSSPRPNRSTAKRDHINHGKQRARSKSDSRSRSPSSSPRMPLKQNGSNGNAAKHRLPPSGPRLVDLSQVKIQPVPSTFAGVSSRSAVAAAYQRRIQLVEPPPAPRSEIVPAVYPPTGPKGMYPPPVPAHAIIKATDQPRRRSAGFKPIGQPSAPVQPAVNSMQQFFPGDDDESDYSTAVQKDDPETRGGGQGFGIIPARSKQANNGRRSPLGVYNRPTASPATSSRTHPPTSPTPSSGGRHAQDYPSSRDHQSLNTPQSDRPFSYSTHDASEEGSKKDVPADMLPPPPRTEVYQLVSQVGEGTFGKVYKAKNVITETFVALKRIKVEAEKDGFPVTALREIKLLQSLNHCNVIPLHEMMVSKGNVYMVMDYMEHDLTGVLSQNQFSFTPGHLKSLCYQMLSGLAYLHQKGVIHRDMKGSNILVNSQGVLKLADFGLARVYQKRRKNDYTNRVITLWYRPPELLLGATVYGPEVDMWSAGTIMLELFTKKAIFPGEDEIHQLQVIYRIMGTATPEIWPGLTDMPWYELVKPTEIHKNSFRSSFEKYLSPAALDLAEGLMTYDPDKRVTAVDAMKSPYFTTEEPPMELPAGLATVEGEWHELETKREKEKTRKRRRAEGTVANGHDPPGSAAHQPE